MPKLIHQETMCCGRKRCPQVKVFDDRSVEISDDDEEIGSIGIVKLRPEAADRLAELLARRKDVIT